MAEEKIKIFSSSQDFLFQLKNYSQNKIELEFESECTDNLEFIEQAGHSIGQLKHISEMSLMFKKNTNLKQEGWRFLFKGLEQLNQLKCLEVQVGEQCFLEDQGLNLLIYAYSSLVNLKKLSLIVENANFISSSCVKNVFDYLKHFPELVELKVQILEFQIDILENKMNIWSGIYSLQQVQSLDLSLNLSYNNEEDIDEFFLALLSLKNLTQLVLNLGYNQQEFDFIEKMTLHLSKYTQLKELSLGLNGKLNEQQEDLLIFTFFQKLTNLEKIDLSKCFGNFLLFSFPDRYYESLSYLPHLRDLKIELIPQSNQKKGSAMKRVNCLCNKQNLRSLQLLSSYTDLNDEQSLILYKALQNNKKMEYLNLQLRIIPNEHLSVQLIESLCCLQQLKQLEIQFAINSRSINSLNQIISAIGNIKSLQNLKMHLNFLDIPNLNQQQLVLSSLKNINLSSFEFQLDAVILGKEFQELGKMLQNQKQLQKLKIIIRFKQYQNFFFLDNQQQIQQQIQNHYQIESIEDFIEGIKSLQNLKELQYGINHSTNTQTLDPIFDSLSYLNNLEVFKLLEDKDYEDSQIVLLTKSLCNLKKLKQLKLQEIKSVEQEVLLCQIENISNLNTLQQLDFFNKIQNIDNMKIGVTKLFLNLSQLQSLQMAIQISQNNELLFEDIITGIGKLKQLQKLKIKFGQYQFTDTGSYHFSQACQGLENLIELMIDNIIIDDDMTQNGIKFLQEGFSKLQKLKIFDSDFYIPTVEFSQILKEFFTKKSLNELNIRVETKEKLNTKDDMEINQQIDQLIETKQNINHNLTKIFLDFEYCLKQQAFQIQKFYENLINLQNLNNLSIVHNWDISYDQNQQVDFTQIFKNLACGFQQFKKLQKLKIQLKNCYFDLEQIPIDNMKCLNNLKNLDLVLNFCSLYSEHKLFDSLKFLNQLQYLNICIDKHSKFGKNAAISLGKSLMHLKMVQKLILNLIEGCQIEQEGAAEIGTGLGYLKNLTFLNIYFMESCKINEIGAIKLGEGISKLLALRELYLTICSNNNITKKAGAFLASSLRNKKYLKKLNFVLLKENNEQGQEFLDEISKFFYESKHLKQSYLMVSFDEYPKYCPDQLKNFISELSGQDISLQISNRLPQIQTKMTIQSDEGQIKFIFSYDEKLTEYYPKIELELMQKIDKSKKIILNFEISDNNISSHKITSVKELIQQLQVQNLAIYLQFYQFSQIYLDEIIFQALKNKELLHFNLALRQEGVQEVQNEVLIQIGKRFSELNLLTLELIFSDSTYENLFTNKYALIFKELSHSKTLRAISIRSPYSNMNKLKRNMKYIQRLVTFSYI
ncbi:hypothetical protein TTHERM_01051820 (macronuclear) [Tetrahymena thermophila SB210]|uniref:Kinase domain protein n=1 Tax=Tetrahymena thermophila (strain SB210) TaxID=312017 RepID=Q235P7_TETTS|nr:hypothetical protein TTHERM_01051820 [Tetrahymena thermophila SB210]EAR92233.2 hypothetical protein TTHERM_01051820 [Tetrahymena thermophila SB210]|eukprot:XP_001012478.2 hypothetical protein TTHERM_01051820 [Tetrahymena thermophila SB210]